MGFLKTMFFLHHVYRVSPDSTENFSFWEDKEKDQQAEQTGRTLAIGTLLFSSKSDQILTDNAT